MNSTLNKRRVITALILGFIAEIINKISPLFVLHFAQNRIGTERFGFAQFAISMVEIFIPFIVFGYSYLFLFASSHHQNAEQERTLLKEIVLLRILHGIIISLVLFGIFQFNPRYDSYRSALPLLVFFVLLSAFDLTFLNIAKQKMTYLSSVSMLAKFATLIAVVLFVKKSEDALLYIALTLGANALVSIASLIQFRTLLFDARISIDSLIKTFKRAIPFALVVTALPFFERFDVVIVESLLGTTATGYYLGCARLAGSLFPLAMAVIGVFLSESVARSDREALTRNTRLASLLVASILLPAAAGSWFVAKPILSLLYDPTFADYSNLFCFLLLGVCAQALIAIFGLQVLLFRNEFRKLFFILLGFLLLGTLIVWPVTALFGLQGAAISAICVKLGAGLSALALAKKHLNRLPWRELTMTALATLVMALALWALQFQNPFLNLIFGGIVFAAAFLLGLQLLDPTLRRDLFLIRRKS